MNFFGYAASTRQSFTQLNLFTEIQITMGYSRPPSEAQLGVQVQVPIHYTTISKYELDKNEPPLTVLVAYARLVRIHIEQIIDEAL